MHHINNKKLNMWIIEMLFLQIAANFFILFNVPIARQIVGFIYFTFVPGFLTIKLLKLKKLDKLEAILFSVGLGIALMMLTGLFLNEFGFLLGISQPLSLIPILVVFNSLTLICVFLVYLRVDDVKLSGKSLSLSPFVLLFTAIPILSFVGAMCVNVYGNNLILLFMIIATSLLFLTGVFLNKYSSQNLYSFAIFMIAIALLFHSSLISKYFVTLGSDVTGEYFVFKITENVAHWSSLSPYIGGSWSGFGRLNSMLSITILPTIYSNLLNIDSVWMFKTLFPLIFSFVPLSLYQLWQTYIGKKYAFISAFLFMSEATFYTEMLNLNRQIVAELFFVLLLLVIANKKMNSVSKMFCFMIFSFGLVTSHYGLAEMFLFFISLAFISLIILKRPSRNITVGMVVFFFVIMFAWYIYTSRSAVFESFLEFGDYVYRQLGDFFNPETRGETVLRGLGLEAPPTIWNMFSRLFAYLTEALIVVGFLGLITKRVKINFEKEYFVLTVMAMTFLGLLILVPGLANTMNMTRFYHVLLFFLAPLCVLGAETIANMISKGNREMKVFILLLIVLVSYFLFQTNFVYEVTGSDSWSVPLSKYRMSTLKLYGTLGYTDAYSVFGSRWLSNNVVIGNTQIYSDYVARNDLRGYGLISPGYVELLSNVTEVATNGVIYLSSLNVNEDILIGAISWNLSEIAFLNDMNKIYTNGGSEVYKNP
jgi:uncharacterized membrane protein